MTRPNLPTLPKTFNLRFIMDGPRPLLQIELYLPWESLLKVAQAIRWAAHAPRPTDLAPGPAEDVGHEA
jgi:hypothetical protein